MNNNRDNYFFMEQVGPKNMIFTQKGQKTGEKNNNTKDVDIWCRNGN